MAKGAFKRGTIKDLADLGQGFSASGESVYSRRSANPPRMVGYVPKGADMIADTERALTKLRGDLLIETNPTRLAKLRKNFEIKSQFIERLKKENAR